MKPTEIELDQRLHRFLDRIRIVPGLDSQNVAMERAKFLAQGETFRSAVPQSNSRRHTGWIQTLVLAFERKELIPMLNTLMIIVITVTILMGGTGASVYAAQGSLPDDTLYPVKTWSEDVRFSYAESVQRKLDLVLDFTDRRVEEITSMQNGARPVPEGVTLRLEQELETALILAAGLDDQQMVQALEQIRLRAETQSQLMTALMSNRSGQADQTLARIQERLQEQVRLAASGEADTQSFRLQVRNRHNQPEQMPFPTPSGTHQQGPGASPDPTGNSYGPVPGSQPTGVPGQYGPGEPSPSQTPIPTGGSYGPGPGAGQPSTTPKNGYGPGTQAGTPTCTPVQNGDGYGSGQTNSQMPHARGSGSD